MRQELPREDLMQEATALVYRVELQTEGEAEPVVLGLRTSGAASVFWGQDIVYHFNHAGQFRRGYEQGRLIKAQQGRLAALTRQRHDRRVYLVRHDFSPDETQSFCVQVEQRLARLMEQLRQRRYTLRASVPADGSVLPAITRALEILPRPLQIAASPRVD